MMGGEREEARPREPGEPNHAVRLNGHRSCADAEDRDLPKVVAWPETRELDRATARVRLTVEHEVRVLAVLTLFEDRRSRRYDELIEDVDEGAEVLHIEASEEAALREHLDVLEAL